MLVETQVKVVCICKKTPDAAFLFRSLPSVLSANCSYCSSYFNSFLILVESNLAIQTFTGTVTDYTARVFAGAVANLKL